MRKSPRRGTPKPGHNLPDTAHENQDTTSLTPEASMSIDSSDEALARIWLPVSQVCKASASERTSPVSYPFLDVDDQPVVVTPESLDNTNASALDEETIETLSLPAASVEDARRSVSAASHDSHLNPSNNLTPRFSPNDDSRIYIQVRDIRKLDIYCGRDKRGASSFHSGNAKYLDIIKSNRTYYRALGSKHGQKTIFRNHLVDKVINGRFIGKDDDGQYYLLTKEKARSKVSQSLRENKKGKKRRG